MIQKKGKMKLFEKGQTSSLFQLFFLFKSAGEDIGMSPL